MAKAVLAPFDLSEAKNTADETKDHDPLSFFPNLPKIRSWRHYEVDTDTKVHCVLKCIEDILHSHLGYSHYFVYMVQYIPCKTICTPYDVLFAGICYGFDFSCRLDF